MSEVVGGKPENPSQDASGDTAAPDSLPSESLELTDVHRYLPNPATGQFIDVTSPVDVANALVEIRELKEKLRILEVALGRVLAEESKKRGEQTMHIPGFKVPVSRSVQITWDLEKLRELKALGLPNDRWEALVKTTVEVKVSANEAKKIARANPEYAKIIEEARQDYVGEPTIGKVERYVNEVPQAPS